jgi:ABC-type lipoprotein release transport system permease subunit
MSKFKIEVMALQGLASKAHKVETESSTALASVIIGISSMRNRPRKTFLTALTIILLTFTIISFASFSSSTGVTETYEGNVSGKNRIEIVRPTHMDIAKDTGNAVITAYAKDFHTYQRSSIFYDPRIEQQKLPSREVILNNPANKKIQKVTSMMGIEPDEIKHDKDLSSMFSLLNKKYKYEPVLLSESVSQKLKIRPGQTMTIFGKKYTFAGNFDSLKMQNFAYMDRSKCIPPDFEETLSQMLEGQSTKRIQNQEAVDNFDVSSFVWSSSEMIAVTTFKGTEDIGGMLTSMHLYPKTTDTDIKSIGKKLAELVNASVLVKTTEGAYKYFFTQQIEGTGFSEVIIPLLLGALIIFSSLMGSIVDREREIFTFSALGLAPPDVAALFFAESSVYAVVGGMGGYLFSQVAAMVMYQLSKYGVFQAPEMNFSSLSTVYTILIVMATVILSTVYPALKAGKSANPGIARKWRMPAPQGEKLSFVFPFTVSNVDIGGILNFLKEHFNNHSDATLGSFAASDVKVYAFNEEGESEYGIEANVSLAPFDLGVMQKFKMYSKKSKIEGIDEVIVELTKLNGAPGTWVRSNRKFIDELRNQFLLWRSLPIETVMHYRQQSKEQAKEV